MFRIKQPIGMLQRITLSICGVVFLLCFYTYLSNQQHKVNPDNTTMPNWTQLKDGLVSACTPRENNLRTIFEIDEKPKSNWEQLWIVRTYTQASKTWLFNDMLATYGHLFIGLTISCIISVFVGLLMGCYEPIAAVLSWPMSLFARIPGTAMLACFFCMAITGEALFITMIVFGSMPILIQSIYLSVKYDVKKEEIDKTYTLGASNFEAIFNAILPKILPKILENIRLQIGPAMVCLIATEMLISEVGMGYQIRMAQKQTQMAIVYNYLAILGLSGLLMDWGMLTLRRRVSPWFSRFK